MKRLSYDVLKEQNYDGYLLENAPEKVLQFGEGNFLRAFIDWMIQKLNQKPYDICIIFSGIGSLFAAFFHECFLNFFDHKNKEFK